MSNKIAMPWQSEDSNHWTLAWRPTYNSEYGAGSVSYDAYNRKWKAVAYSSELLDAEEFIYLCDTPQKAKDKVDQILIENGWTIMSEKAALLL